MLKILYYDRINISEGIDPTKSNNSKECIIRYCWFFSHGFKFQDSVCNDYHDLTMLCLNINDIAITALKGTGYYCIIHDISKFEAIDLFCIWKSSVFIKIHIKEINIKNRVYNYY